MAKEKINLRDEMHACDFEFDLNITYKKGL